MEAIILAGGSGTRLQKVISDVPKPMAPISGRPFLEHLADYWAGQKIDKFIFAIGYQYEKIQKHFGTIYRGVPIEYAIEKKPLGTGGGLLQSMGLLRHTNEFLVLNGDTYFAVALDEFRKKHQAAKSGVSIALFEVHSGSRYGTVRIDEKNLVLSFEEKNQKAGKSLINGGVYLMNENAFKKLPSFADQQISLEHDILPNLLKEKTVYAFNFPGKFIDIGIPEDYEKAKILLTS